MIPRHTKVAVDGDADIPKFHPLLMFFTYKRGFFGESSAIRYRRDDVKAYDSFKTNVLRMMPGTTGK